jgi:basic membrane protein A
MVGSVGGIDYPVVVRSHEAFQAGVHWAVQGNWDTANPVVDVKTLYCGSWIDPAAGKISAQTLIQEGADCLIGQADSSTIGVIDAAEEAGNVIISYNDYVGGFAIAPDIIVSTVAIRSDRMVRLILENMEAGTIHGGLWRPALASGIVELAINPEWDDKLTTEQKNYIEEVKAAVINGDIEVPYVFEKSGVPPVDF